jgi:hypothetical protein
MDRERFDALARLLARGGSRRETLAVLISVALLRQSPDSLGKDKHQGHGGEGVQKEGRPGAAHKQHHKRKHTPRRRRKQRRQQDRD